MLSHRRWSRKVFTRPQVGRGERRLRLERLERRDCPAVQPFFDAGVLTVVGDAANNVIELFQPRDRVVQVVGDGRTWTFEEVDEVLVDAGDGDDRATSSKPKEIVVVGSKIKMEMGGGNDTVKIDDGGPLEEPLSLMTAMDFSVDLGSGADAFHIALGNTSMLDLIVRSADGGDRVDAGHTIGLRHEHVRPEARIDIDLGGGGNFVDVRGQNVDDVEFSLRAAGGHNVVQHELGHALGFRHEHTRPEAHIDIDLDGDGNFVEVRLEEIENVDLSIVAVPAPGEPVTGGTINVYFHVIRRGSGVVERDDGVVILTSSLPGGDAIGVSPSALSFTATAGGASGTSASVAFAAGAANDSISILSRNVDVLALDLRTGDGDDLVSANVEHSDTNSRGNWSLIVVDAGVGDDELTIHAQANRPLEFPSDSRSAGLVVDLGDGNNRLLAETVGFDEVEQHFRSGDGHDRIAVSDRAGPFYDFKPTRLRQTIRTGGGNDIVLNDSDGRQVVDAIIDVGSGNDAMGTRWGTAFSATGTRLHVDVLLGAGSDVAVVEALGYGQIAATVETGPAGDGRDLVIGSFRLSPLERVRRVRRAVDGGQDLFELLASANYDVEATAGEQSLIVVFTRTGSIPSFPVP